MNMVKGVLDVENDRLSSLPLTSAESANIPKAIFEQTEKERWRECGMTQTIYVLMISTLISFLCVLRLQLTRYPGVKQALMDRRRQLEFSIYPYESHTRKLISKLMEMKDLANNYIIHLKRIESYRWSVSVGKRYHLHRSTKFTYVLIFYTDMDFLIFFFFCVLHRNSDRCTSSLDFISVQYRGKLLFTHNMGKMLFFRVR